MASELKTPASPNRESQDGMAKLARTIRDKILIDEPVKEEELIDQLERAAIEIDELLGSSLGPKGMNKIIVNPVGDIFVTSDGKVILKEMDVLHPIVTSLKKLAESMDKACGDGTKTAVIFASNLIKNAVRLIRTGVHPTIIIEGYELAMQKAYEMLQYSIKQASEEDIRTTIMCSATGKGIERQQAEAVTDIVLQVIKHLSEKQAGRLDLNRNIKILKKKGGSEIVAIEGLIMDENPAREDMPKSFQDPAVLIINYDLKIKSGYLNPQHNLKMDSVQTSLLFEERKKQMCGEIARKIIDSGANVLFCEGDIDPYIETLLRDHEMLAFKKLKTKDLEKLSEATGTTLKVFQDEIRPCDLGKADSIRLEKKNGENFVFITVKEKAIATIMIWEPIKYGLDKVEEAVDDALNNAAFLMKNREIVNGGGAIEFELAHMVRLFAATQAGKKQLAVQAYAEALEKIPTILARNMGMNAIDAMAQMKNSYSRGIEARIDLSRKVTDQGPKVYDSATVKKLAIIAGTETAKNVLRIDEIVPKR
ncbi:MAG: TCP-1/cpn60 chaperonin family protein [Methanosarcina sp.]|uniref:TCP-1/cpn60 chaperonin family protein n=1 Tax=Methanosarcina sp. TaxID=2213 RepID=UPI00261D5848|nr:TCP-1/cpn60 chaperonin family protein [Methanosarcina sp.]MDD3245293.1 TCP-1/cpn60 chaperonin family protein [Methanosarcina sp.]